MASNSVDIAAAAVPPPRPSDAEHHEPNIAPDPYPESSESEWEYEYDDNETETFYLTIELTPTLPAPNAKPRRGPKDFDGIYDADEQSADDRDVPIEDGGQNSVEERHEFDEDAPRRIQILDFHSPDPLVSFQNRIYHCEWASSISSSLYFTAHNPSDVSTPTMRSTPQYNLIGISSARITSTAAHLAPKNTSRPTIDDLFVGEDRQPHGNIASAPTAIDTLTPIQLNPSVDASRKAQASFLERLSAIKRAAGEQDEVTVIAKKVLHGTGWRYQRRNKLEMLEDRVEEGDELAVRVLSDMYTPSRRPEVVGRPESGLGSRGGRVKTRYARGRPGRPRTSGMNALFDHIFIKDNVESGSAEALGYTPTSWDDLGTKPDAIAPSQPSRDTPEPIVEHQGELTMSRETSVPQSERRNFSPINIRSTRMPDAPPG
ncbi:MAG: hypothetical protein M1839_000031 [Geoglossum umbratile]|nr:MAG: hypothetical protein M1839_000031 [Geoglossum umbratile]